MAWDVTTEAQLSPRKGYTHLFLSLSLPGEIALRVRGETKAGAVHVIKDAAWSSFIPCGTEAGVEGRTVTASSSRGAFRSKTGLDNWRDSPDASPAGQH